MKWELSFVFYIFIVYNLSQYSNVTEKKDMAVKDFNLERYLGRWYEIVRMPSSFEKDLTNVTANYSLRSDGKVKVLNSGYKDNKNGKYTEAAGRAKFFKDSNIGHLKVSFFWPFYADYIIIDLDKEKYSYAMVSSSNSYLWILSRSPQMDREILNRLLEKAESLGYDMEKIIFVSQDWAK